MTDNPGYVIKTEFIKKHDIVNRYFTSNRDLFIIMWLEIFCGGGACVLPPWKGRINEKNR